MVIDVSFLLLADKVPILLSIRDMIKNGLYLSLQECVLKYKGRRHGLSMEKYFLIHRWTPGDMPFALYTETKIRSFHRYFDHPSVKATEIFLKGASGGPVDKETTKAIDNISDACKICKKMAPPPRRFNVILRGYATLHWR